MKLYHGTKAEDLTVIKKSQAEAGEDVSVPDDELLNAIYLTPNYGYALAMATRPEGVARIDDEKMKIEFEKPELFDPDREVYVCELEVPDELVRKIDDNQCVVEGVDELKTEVVHAHKAGEIEQYYELVNWKKEANDEFKQEIKIK